MANQSTIVVSLSDATLKRGSAGSTTLPAATLVDTVENVNLKLTFEEAPANNRRTKIKQSLPTLCAVEIEINFPVDSADTHLAAFRTAMLGLQCIPIQVADGSGAFTFNGLVGVFSGENDQQLPAVVGNKFSLKPWAVGASGTQPTLT